jgi:hypothetical protein
MFTFDDMMLVLLVLAIPAAIIAAYIAVGYITVIIASWLGAWIWDAVVAAVPFAALLLVVIEVARRAGAGQHAATSAGPT